MRQSELFFQDKQPQALPMPDAEVIYYPNWLSSASADKYLATFLTNLSWSQEEIKIFGKMCKSPRLQAWYGNSEATYTYSGLQMQPLPWTKELLALKTECEQVAATSFNSVLANLYRNGADSMGFHSDDEAELGLQPVIASVSLGADRHFDFKHKHNAEKFRITLQHGSLLVMRGDTQTYWKHGINKTKRPVSSRINLTFRNITSI